MRGRGFESHAVLLHHHLVIVGMRVTRWVLLVGGVWELGELGSEEERFRATTSGISRQFLLHPGRTTLTVTLITAMKLKKGE